MRSVMRSLFAAAVLLFAVVQDSSAAEWRKYGRDLKNSFNNSEETIVSPLTAPLLVRKWFFPTLDAVTASPAVADGVVYIGDWHGFFWALDAMTGIPKWRFEVDPEARANPDPQQFGFNYPDRFGTDGGVITSSAAVVDMNLTCDGTPSTRVVFFGGSRTLYALDAETGKLCWKRVVCGNPDAGQTACEADPNDPNRIFSSPAVYDGKVFIGWTIDGIDDNYRGGFGAFSVTTGDPLWNFDTDRDGTINGDVLTRGCGGVWSSAAIDDQNNLVFFNTADCGFDAPPPFHEAIIALHTGDGSVAWYYRPRDTLVNGSYDICDFDFGASPNVIDFNNARYVGNGGKDGTYYLLNPTPSSFGPDGKQYPESEVVWKKNVVFGGLSGGFIGSTASDGTRIYGATALGDFNPPGGGACTTGSVGHDEPSIHAFNVDPASSSRMAWQETQNQSFGGTSVAGGVVFNGGFYTRTVNLRDAESGMLVGLLTTTGASVSSTPAIVDGSVYFGAGDSFHPLAAGVHAYWVPTTALSEIGQ